VGDHARRQRARHADDLPRTGRTPVRRHCRGRQRPPPVRAGADDRGVRATGKMIGQRTSARRSLPRRHDSARDGHSRMTTRLRRSRLRAGQAANGACAVGGVVPSSIIDDVRPPGMLPAVPCVTPGAADGRPRLSRRRTRTLP